jgi:sulfoxide reductase heme-binding subunit YedZ
MKTLRPPTKLIPILIHAAAWIPGLVLLFRALTDQLTADPIQYTTLRTGKYALILLLASLAMTPLKNISGWAWTMTARKWFGLYAFLYALIHLTIYVGLDYGFAWVYIIPELLQKPYLMVGTGAFLILLAMAVTSFRWWMDRLGRIWTYLHRLVYGAGVLVILHFAWVRKGDIFTLKGDVLEPLLYGAVFILLLMLRIPWIRRRISIKQSLQRKIKSSNGDPIVVRRVRSANQGGHGE